MTIKNPTNQHLHYVVRQSLFDKLDSGINAMAIRRYNKRYSITSYRNMINVLANQGLLEVPNMREKIISQCLAACGHSNHAIDKQFISILPKDVILYILTFA